MISLLDSGATENFLNLDYTKWLKLPIKRLPFPRKLFNVDGTENKAGQLQFYTDLAIHTGSTSTNMRFFLTQLGEHKAILGYLGLQQYNQKLTGGEAGSITHNCRSYLKPKTQLKHDSCHEQ